MKHAHLAAKKLPDGHVYFGMDGQPCADVSANDQPKVSPEGSATDSILGPWTRVGARTALREVWFGRYSYVVNDASIVHATVGNFCSIARDTRINPGNHPMWRASQHHYSYRSNSYELGDDDEAFLDWRRQDHVTLGHDVWIGHGAVILAGVSVGTGAVVGAAAPVAKDVDDYSIVGGVPARVIRPRFPELLQQALKSMAWWDWPHDKLQETLPDMRALDAASFVEKYS